MGQLLGAAGQHDEHAVDAPAALDVQVAVDDVAGAASDAHDAAELDLLLERDLEVLEAVLAIGDGLDALGGDQAGQLLGLELEVLAGGDEVGLALQLDERADLLVDDEGHDALGVLPVVALGAGGEALLAQPVLGGLHVAVVGLEGLLRIHHPGAGGLAQGLDVLGGERHLDQLSSFSVVVSTVVGRSSVAAAAVGGGAARRRPARRQPARRRRRSAGSSAGSALGAATASGSALTAPGRAPRPARRPGWRRGRRRGGPRARPGPGRRRCGPRSAGP